MTDLKDLIVQAGALAGALAVIGGLMWWIFGPRVRESVRSMLLTALDDAKVHERIQLLELQIENHERRIGTSEQTLISHFARPGGPRP